MGMPSSELGGVVAAWCRSSSVSARQIARAAGVNLSTVYRIMADGEKYRSRGSALKKICKIANIDLNHRANARGQKLPKELTDAMLQIWDGTPGHAKRIIRSIYALARALR